MRKFPALLLAALLLINCNTPAPILPMAGIWRANLDLGKAHLPFNFELNKEGEAYQLTIINGSERLDAESVETRNDSVFIQLAVFNSVFVAALTDSLTMRGYWQDFSRGSDYKIPFEAKAREISRFEVASKSAPATVAGKWATTFSPNSTDPDYPTYPAIGVFEQASRKVTGTFLTETGDYRFLQGVADGDSLKLSAFDGSHAFLFLAKATVDSLNGVFYSGNHWEEPWVAARNESASLRHPDSLTFLKPGFDQMKFTFPNLTGETISLSDSRYQGKVVIVQLTGSWCPNCMDETKLFREYYDTYRDQGLEIVALAFERGSDQETAIRNLTRLKDRFGVEYELLLADFTGEKGAAETALPMVNQVMAFPTSFFLDRNGRIRKIHTGFYGPGTGDLYTEFVAESSSFIERLLGE